MGHRFILTGFLLTCFKLSYTQNKTESFQINLPEEKIRGSLYKSIQLVDIRQDTTTLGIVQKGAFNKQTTVVAQTPLAMQLSAILSAFNDFDAREGELVLLLRHFSFAEITKAASEFGYCHFRAVLFAKVNLEYKKLETIDTVLLVRAMDVTKKMLREGSHLVTEFIARNMIKVPEGNLVISWEQLPLIDSLEKRMIPLYTTTTYTDGLYYNYRSFANQQPDETGLSVSFDKKNRVQQISYTNKKGQKTEIENRFFYAFIYKGLPYISGEFSCYPLERRGDDFYFKGKVNNARNTDIAAAQFFFGIMGALMASSATAILEMKLDYLTGGFMPIKDIGSK